MKLVSLNQKQVEALSKDGRHAVGGDGCHGLGLLIQGESRIWMFRAKHHGRVREMSLGPTNRVTLKAARIRTREIRQELAEGKDPFTAQRDARAEKAAATQALTFEEMTLELIAIRSPEWKDDSGTEHEWRATFGRYVFPKWKHRHANDLTVQDVLRVLKQPVGKDNKPLWEAKTPTAERLRMRMELVFEKAIAEGKRTDPNPAQWAALQTKLTKASVLINAKKTPHVAIPFREMPQFWLRLLQRKGMTALALRFTILTVSRADMVLGAKWPEFDLERRIWTVPQARMKGKKGKAEDFRIPLSTAAMRILRGLSKHGIASDYVFFSPSKVNGGLTEDAMRGLLQRSMAEQVNGEFADVHGFRSSFADWAYETHDVDQSEVIEKCQAHAVGNTVRRAYHRADLLERRTPLIEEWGQYVESELTAASQPTSTSEGQADGGAVVINLRRASSLTAASR
jgi:integrase